MHAFMPSTHQVLYYLSQHLESGETFNENKTEITQYVSIDTKPTVFTPKSRALQKMSLE